MTLKRKFSPMHCTRSHVLSLMILGVLSGFADQASAQFGGGPTAVHVKPVQEMELQERRLVTGDLRASHRSDIAAREAGAVIEILVFEGQRISAGDTIARLDADRLDIEILQTEADHEVANTVLIRREATLERSERDLEIVRTSFERGAADQREYLNAQTDVKIAKAEVSGAEKQIAVIAARRALLEKRLSDMTITAPFAGVVVARHVELGEWLSEGDAVVELVATESVEAWINVPQRFLGSVSAGLSSIQVALDVDAPVLPMQSQRLVPQVDPRSRTFAVIARIANPDLALAPGMSVVTWIPTGNTGPSLVLPADAILRNDTGTFVYVVRETEPDAPPNAVPMNVRVQYPVKGGFVIARDGLQPGDLVVTEGNERLFPMTPIQPIQHGVKGAAAAGGGS